MSLATITLAWSIESNITCFGSNTTHDRSLLGKIDEVRIDTKDYTYNEMLAAYRSTRPTTETNSVGNVSSSVVLSDPGLLLKDGVSAPSTVTGYAIPFVDSSDGDFKIRFGDGLVKTIASDTNGSYTVPAIKTSSYTLTTMNFHVIFNSASDVTAWLPASTGDGINYRISNINTGEVTIVADGADLITDEATQYLVRWESMDLADIVAGLWGVF